MHYVLPFCSDTAWNTSAMVYFDLRVTWWQFAGFITEKKIIRSIIGGMCPHLEWMREAEAVALVLIEWESRRWMWTKRPHTARYKWIVKQRLAECFQSISGASFVSRNICQQPYWFSNMAEIGWELEHCKSGYKSRQLRHSGVRTTSNALSETKFKR